MQRRTLTTIHVALIFIVVFIKEPWSLFQELKTGGLTRRHAWKMSSIDWSALEATPRDDEEEEHDSTQNGEVEMPSMGSNGNAQQKPVYNIDDGSNREDEFAEFERNEEIRKKEKQKQEEEAKNKEAQKHTEEKKTNLKKRQSAAFWGPILIIGPFTFFIFALFTIFTGSIIVNWSPYLYGTENAHTPSAQRYGQGARSCLELRIFISGCIGVSYVFLFFYAFILMGPSCIHRNCCSTVRLVMIWYAVLFVICFGVYVFGTYSVVAFSACGSYIETPTNIGRDPYLWNFSVLYVSMWWLGLLGMIGYAIWYAVWEKENKKKRRGLVALMTTKKKIDYSGYRSLKEEFLEEEQQAKEQKIAERKKKKEERQEKQRQKKLNKGNPTEGEADPEGDAQEKNENMKEGEEEWTPQKSRKKGGHIND